MERKSRGLRLGAKLRSSDGANALHDDDRPLLTHRFTISLTTTVPRDVILMMLRGWLDLQPWLYDDMEVK